MPSALLGALLLLSVVVTDGASSPRSVLRTSAQVTSPAPARTSTAADDARLGPPEELVVDLPGYGAPPFPQYSGFLDASSAEPGTKLHYWFARSSADDWATKPTVLWLNGGPGSSSILGFLQENGPLLVNRTGGLMSNPWAWTIEANMVALESPAGVGYSYCSAQLSGGACANTDNSTASAALAALVDFFHTKFPSLAANPFYITGESYAGVYVPTLARAILDHNDAEGTAKINLAGLAAGDPCTDNKLQADSMDMLWYGHKHGFVPEVDFDLLWNSCKVRYAHPMARGRWGAGAGATPGEPAGWRGSGEHPLPRRLLDDDEAEEDDATWGVAGAEATARVTGAGAGSRRRRSRPLDATKDPPACIAAHRRFLIASSDAFSQSWQLAWLNDLSLYGPSAVVRNDVPGTLDYMMAAWMMRADVRAALHVDHAPAKEWPGPAAGWTYTSQWGACNDEASPGTPSMVDFYRYLAPRLRTTLVFNGDTDPCVSYEGTRQAVIAVGFEQLPGGAQRPYFFNASSVPLSLLAEKPLFFGPDLAVVPAGPQFGGHVTNYGNRLSFVTVHGSGHMVPQFRPRVGLHLLRKLVSGQPFSPLLPSDAALRGGTEHAFRKEMDAWTLAAQTAEFLA